MKPVNFDSQPCNPISSNCIVWQGPNIPCIALCTGDTISDVVAALATELCTVLDTLNVNNYDLTCFNITTCKPKDFIALIDFITKQICELQGISPVAKSAGGCPDCMLSVPECLNAPEPVMNLAEYVNFLATKICGIIGDIADLNTRVDNLDVRVTYIEQHCCDDTPPPAVMVDINCDVPTAGNYEISQAFESFINDFFCNYYNYTLGDITNLEDAILSQCILNTDYTKSDPLVQYGNLTSLGWVNTPGTVADTIRNLWLVVCDLYDQQVNSPITVVDAGTGITVSSTVVDDTTTYTVSSDYLETFTATLNIIDDYAPSSGKIPNIWATNPEGSKPINKKGVTAGQEISKYTFVASNSIAKRAASQAGAYVTQNCMPTFTFGSFDNVTGIFTVTDPGTYLIHANIHLKPNDSSSIFWSGTNPSDIGSFILGITPNNLTDVWQAQGQTLVPNIDKNVEISLSKVVQLGLPSTFVVKVLNTTNRSYDGTTYGGADFIHFSITKLRDNITSTICAGV